MLQVQAQTKTQQITYSHACSITGTACERVRSIPAVMVMMMVMVMVMMLVMMMVMVMVMVMVMMMVNTHASFDIGPSILPVTPTKSVLVQRYNIHIVKVCKTLQYFIV